MNIVGMFLQSLHYHWSSKERQEKIIQKRLKRLISYVRVHSAKLSELYSGIEKDFSLEDLPITNKKMIMENFNEWVTDSDVSIEKIKEFADDKNNVGKRFKNKYIVASTSGSTGYPLLFLIDRTSIDSSVAESMLDSAMKYRPVCMLYSTSSFLISTGILMENMKRFPFIKRYLKLLDSTLPTNKLVSMLNEIKPKSIYSYVSTMEILADEYLSGRLKISLKEIVCAGERLTPKTRKYFSEVFGCKVKSMYGSTEAGNIAYECDYNHFHLYNSWNIIEAVDANNNPVPYGQPAEKILLTNLSNYTVPIIRYELTDRVIIHDNPCPCGKKEIWLELEGRSVNNLLIFMSGEREVKISPVSVYILLETMDTIRLFQLVLHGYNKFEFRIDFMPMVDETAVFDEAKSKILSYLHQNGIANVEIYLSDKKPEIDPKTLKLKNIYQEI